MQPRGDSTAPTTQCDNPGEHVPAVRTLALQVLYAADSVKEAFARLSHKTPSTSSTSDDDDGSDNEEWEDNMGPITFMRYFAARNPNPLFDKLLEDHDKEERARLDRTITGWAVGVADAAEGF